MAGGGYAGGYQVHTGGRYDPATDTWTPTTTGPGPSGRTGHTALWTGTLMIVYGGSGINLQLFNTGGRYDPATDSWAPTSLTNAPYLTDHTAVWTGDLMLVWGGGRGRYDPLNDSWIPVSNISNPSASGHTAVWTGQEMIVWGNGGVRYDPSTDTWRSVSTIGAPLSRAHHSAVWTGTAMLIWGGEECPTCPPVNSGRIYDPATDVWTPMSTVDAPAGRHHHTAIFTGDPATSTGGTMVIWGACPSPCAGGARYDPGQDRWSTVSTTDAPAPAFQHSAVWTGTRMIVWGGSWTNVGGKYDPVNGHLHERRSIATIGPHGSLHRPTDARLGR